MRIGEIATKSGLSTKTIRYYEGIGLVPEPRRSPSGYREYAEPVVSRLDFIKAAQSVGFTLGEIREILAFRDKGQAPCDYVSALIDRHSKEITIRIEALQSMQADLGRLAGQAKRLVPSGAGFCHIIEDGR